MTDKKLAPQSASEQDKEAKPSRSIGPLRKIFPYVKNYPGLITGAVIFLVLAASTTLALPLAVRRMIDNGFSAENSAFIDTYFSFLIVIAIVLAIASACRYFFVIALGERVVADIRSDVFAHITKLSSNFFDEAQSGELVSRLAADTTQIKSAVGATASLALRNIILGIGATGAMVATSPRLAAFVGIVIPVIALPVFAFGRAVRKRSREAQDTLAQATAFASEQIGAIRTIKAFTAEDQATARFSSAVESAHNAARGAILSRSVLTFVAILSIFTSIVCVLWIGASNVLDGTMTPGTLGQFLLFALIAAGALGALSEVWGELSQAAGAAERLTELLATDIDIQSPRAAQALPSKAEGGVILNHVQFAYPSRPDQIILHDVSFEVRSGETVAIVGPSGAGKSTIFALLQRMYDVTNGHIQVDGVDVASADLDALRDRFAIVPQDVAIFAMSARENIAFAKPNADETAIMAAAKAANADEFLTKLPEGYDTQLGERGVTLSGGQRQRVAIARAILRDAPILLLDEATSALDAESEAAVQQALDGLMHNRTTIIIAHRLATIRKADRIIVMEDGRIVETGDHDELVKLGGTYARLAALQFTQV